MGLRMLPHQLEVWDVALEVQSEEAGDPSPGAWAYDDIVVTWPRRGGKSVLIQPVVMHRAELIRRAFIVMTAQTGKSATKRWKDLADTIEDSYLRDRVRKRESVGRERLTWIEQQSSLEPFAAKEDAAHGDEPDLALADEFWKFDAAQGASLDQSIRPTFLTNNAQFWRYSTAGTVESAYYNAARRAGRNAVEDGVRLGRYYNEFSVPDEVDGVKVELLDDDTLLDLVVAHHPRQDLPNLRPFLAQELERAQEPDAPGRGDFLRAYGNHVPDVAARPALVPAETMAAALSADGIPADARVGMAVEVDPDQREASITVGWRRPDGRGVTKVLRCEPGALWVAREVIAIRETGGREVPQVTMNDTTPNRDVMDQLVNAGVTVAKVGAKDYTAACTRWYTETTTVDAEKRPAPTALHRGDPALIGATRTAGWRDMPGGGKAFAVLDEPITALTGTALALWAADHLPEPEPVLGPFKIR